MMVAIEDRDFKNIVKLNKTFVMVESRAKIKLKLADAGIAKTESLLGLEEFIEEKTVLDT